MKRVPKLTAACAVICAVLPGQKKAADWTDDDLFPRDRVLEVEITVAKKDWKALCRQTRSLAVALGPDRKGGAFDKPFTYITGDVCIDGVTFEKVGIRKKGFLGSLSNVRPSLKIKFHHTVKGARIAGRKNLTFNNNQQDESLASQFLTYKLCNEAGVPAPRVAFARVTVNGKYLGIYCHVEAVREPMLERGFGTSRGVLFEGTVVDFVKGWTKAFEHKLGDVERGRARIEEFVAALDEASDEQVLQAVGSFVDLDAFYKYWALEGLLGIWDGYTAGQNNFFVYLHPDDQRFRFVPWGADASFVEYGMEGRIEGAPMSVKLGARLSHRLYQSKEGRARYKRAILQLLSGPWNEQALLAECDRLEELLDPHLGRTQRRMTDRLDDLKEFVEQRRKIVLDEIDGGMPLWDRKPGKPFVMPKGGWGALPWASARDGDITAMSQHLRRGASVNMRSDYDGGSLLGLAAVAGEAEMVRFLLDKGAKVNAQNDEGHTPLHGAAFFGRLEVCRILVDAGADVGIRSKDGATVLDSAAGAWTAEIEAGLKSLGKILELDVDLDEIRAQRPKVAAMLRERGAKPNQTAGAGKKD